ncbi:hypothetical protein ACET3Z_002492 [Daucus carota]
MGDNGNQFQNLNFQKDDRRGSRRVSRRESYADNQLLKFIWAHNRLVDKEVLVQLNIGDETAIRSALEQIHTRSLNGLGVGKITSKGYTPKSYSEVLVNSKAREDHTDSLVGETNEGEWTKVSYKKRTPVRNVLRSPIATIFLHSIPDGATGAEIWNLFKGCGNILDIILPKKRDRLGKRFGFVKTTDDKEAGAIICNAKQDKRLGSKISMTINGKKENSPSHKQPASERAFKSQGVEVPVKATTNKGDSNTQLKEVPFGKRMFEFTEVEVDFEVEKALLDSKVGITWFEEEVSVLKERFRDMGLGGYKIMGLSKRKFLISKGELGSWENLEKSDLSVWFCMIRKYEEMDHILTRQVWIECRGLPMPAWLEENLRAFTDRLGTWISWSYQSDNLGELFNPLICIDTVNFDEIKEDMKVLYKGKQINISFVEVGNYSMLQDKILPMEFSEENKHGTFRAEGEMESRVAVKDKKVEGNQVSPKVSSEDCGVKEKVVNPAVRANECRTFKSDQADVVQQASPKEGSEVVSSEPLSYKEIADTIVKSPVEYRQISTSSGIFSEGTQDLLENDRSEVYVPVQIASSQSTLCSGLVKKLRVKSKRGRPKKDSGTQRNPFEIGVKFKVRGGNRAKPRNSRKLRKRTLVESDLQTIPLQVAGSNAQEAIAILESAENMGLVCRGDREMVIKQIVKKLDDKVL